MTAADELERTDVVTVFQRNRAAVLLLCRSDEVGSYAGQWGAVAGHAEGDPRAAARAEIREETGIDPERSTTLVRQGEPFDVPDADLGTRWVVHPFLFDCETRTVEPNYETAAAEWVPPPELLRRETVPDLWKSYDRVRPTPATIAADDSHGSAYLSIRALEVLRDESALAAERGGRWAALEGIARELVESRPEMAVLVTRVDRAMHTALDGAGDAESSGTSAALEAAAEATIADALDADDTAADNAEAVLPADLATLSWSETALSAIERAGAERVLVAESRPGREGLDTAERLADRTDAAITVTTDAAFPALLAARDVDALVVGADAVLPDGRVRNKVGTRAAATVATRADTECVVVTASDKIAGWARPTVDGMAEDGASAGERRRSDSATETRPASDVYDGDADIAVTNPVFDTTPTECVRTVVTEHGALDRTAVRERARAHRELAAWRT